MKAKFKVFVLASILINFPNYIIRNIKLITRCLVTLSLLLNISYKLSAQHFASKNPVNLDSLIAGRADGNLKQITDSVDKKSQRLPIEKVYLHTDKPYYNIGDTLWFKGYVVNADLTPSKISGLLYVELDNDSAEMIRRVSIRLKDWMAWAQIPLSKKIFREGGYTLRAYTNWMQNFGESAFFSQRFYLGLPAQTSWLVNSEASTEHIANKAQLNVLLKLKHPDVSLSPVALKKVEVKIYDEWHYYLYKEEMQTGIDGSLKLGHELKDKIDGKRIQVQITSLEKTDGFKQVQIPLDINPGKNLDLQFLPEGGKLVAGLKSVVGFKAIGEDGKGIPVSGGIYNLKGEKITSFVDLHNGMGSFEFTPEAGMIYTAKIEQPGGIIKTFTMPATSTAGTVMHVINPDGGNDLKITLTGLKTGATDNAFYLLGTARGAVYYSQNIILNGAQLTIPKKNFPTGIVRFTLFKGIKPLNERAVFVDNHDQLKVTITPGKTSYRKRDSVALEIEVKDKNGLPVQGNFSLAVTDNSQVKSDRLGNNDIATNLLLTTDLKGNVEEPGYYINRKDEQAWHALDNLLLTQGWTGYDWNNVFAPIKPPAFKAEKDFEITGRVVNILNKPVANTEVLISSQKPAFITTTRTDDQGIYTFKNLPTIDSGSFFIQANNAKGKQKDFGELTVNKFKAPNVGDFRRSPLIPWYVNTDTTQLNYVKKDLEKENEDYSKLTENVLKEVVIQQKKIIKGSANPYGPGSSDLAFDQNDIKASAAINLYDFLIQQVPGLKVVGLTTIYPYQPKFQLDKFRVDPVLIDGLPLTVDVDINASLEDIKDDLRTYPAASLRGVEVIYSRKFTNRSAGQEGKFRSYDFAKIILTTYNGLGWFRNFSNTTKRLRPIPILYPQQFYSPKYNKATPIITPDYRSTLYWEPNILTNKNGKVKICFYASDVTGNYTVNLQGGSADGNYASAQVKLNIQ